MSRIPRAGQWESLIATRPCYPITAETVQTPTVTLTGPWLLPRTPRRAVWPPGPGSAARSERFPHRPASSHPATRPGPVRRAVRDHEHTKVQLKAESLYPTMAGRLNATAAFQAPAFLCRKV